MGTGVPASVVMSAAAGAAAGAPSAELLQQLKAKDEERMP